MNYESELQQVFVDSLKLRYGIEDDHVLFRYFFLRFFIFMDGQLKNNRRQNLRDIIRFFCDELGLPEGEVFTYKGEQIKKGFAIENSMENIMETWMFENRIRPVVDEQGQRHDVDEYLNGQMKKITSYAKNKASAKVGRQHQHFLLYWKFYALEWLNRVYGATVSEPRLIEGIDYPESHALKKPIEDILGSQIMALERTRYDVASITEKHLEEFLYPRLHLIEEGMRGIERQKRVGEGRIDIFARDKNNVPVVIELKVEEDKELVWQCMYYSIQIQKLFHASRVRVITLAPEYSEPLLEVLTQLAYVEPMIFIPTVRYGKVHNLQIQKLKQNAA